MFRVISILALVITYIFIAISLKNNQANFKKWFSIQSSNIAEILTNLKKSNTGKIIKSLLLPIIFLCINLLALTGFVTIIILGKPISTYMLLIHVSLAPLFAICMVIVTLLWAPKNNFDKKDWETFCNLKSSKKEMRIELFQKVGFWLIIVLTLPIILSILLSMYPIFGSEIQHSLLTTHRYTTLVFVIISTWYVYFSIIKDSKQTIQKQEGHI
jgi:hypothetical protein